MRNQAAPSRGEFETVEIAWQSGNLDTVAGQREGDCPIVVDLRRANAVHRVERSELATSPEQPARGRPGTPKPVDDLRWPHGPAPRDGYPGRRQKPESDSDERLHDAL